MVRGILMASTLIATPVFGGQIGTPLPTSDDVPNVMIVQVPEVNSTEAITDQRADTDVDVFSLRVEVVRTEDGGLDVDAIRQEVLDLMKQTPPVTVKIGSPEQTIANLPPELQQKFHEVEMDSVAAATPQKAVVAWRGYGPVNGYSRGIVAFNRTPYRGYYPYRFDALDTTRAAGHGINPYFGFYANGRNYPFAYLAHRSTPSYHYFAYVRGY